MAFNKKTHLRQNIDALKTAFTLDRERRAPTPEEERTLGAYSGFGAIKEVLENPTGKPDKDGMATLVAELHEVIRANTPDEREYKRYMDGIKNSVLTAFYTPPKVADAIVEAIWDTRIVPKRILDPSAGTGVFVSAVDFHAPYAEITCFEKDPATGLILKHLHPEKRVRVQGFERIEPKYAGYYDVAVSNIPFGDVALFDPFFSTHTDPVRRQGTRALHNYFFMKSVDMVREGGLVAFITSQGVLNAEQGRPVREWLMNRCEPVSAIRLPNNLFTEHAGTEVGSDLVILQKKAATGELSERQRDFIESRKLSNGIRINNLFQSFDRVIHTEAKVGKDPYGKPAMEFTHAEGVDGIDREMRRMLSEDFNCISTRVIAWNMLRNRHPVHRSGNCPVPVRRNASVPKDTSPALPEKSSRRLSPMPVTFSSSGKRRKNAASSPKWRRRATMSIPKPGRLPESKTNPDKCYRILLPHPPENRPGRIWPTSGPGRKSGRIACGSSTRRNPKISAWQILPCSTWAE